MSDTIVSEHVLIHLIIIKSYEVGPIKTLKRWRNWDTENKHIFLKITQVVAELTFYPDYLAQEPMLTATINYFVIINNGDYLYLVFLNWKENFLSFKYTTALYNPLKTTNFPFQQYGRADNLRTFCNKIPRDAG